MCRCALFGVNCLLIVSYRRVLSFVGYLLFVVYLCCLMCFVC